MIVCEEKKIVRGKKEIRILFIILLGSLYYFIELYVNRDVGWIVKWVSKIDKIVFFFYTIIFTLS